MEVFHWREGTPYCLAEESVIKASPEMKGDQFDSIDINAGPVRTGEKII